LNPLPSLSLKDFRRGDMQPTIDKIIEHFYSNVEGGVDRACELYNQTFSTDDIQRENYGCGEVVPNEELEFDYDRLDLLEGCVGEERLEALSDGADPTDDELREYQDAVIRSVKDGSADYDIFPAYWLHRLKHTDGREVIAMITVKGYSFSGVQSRFEGLFHSVDDAMTDLAKSAVIVK
jgi:hypothetical protein